MSEELEATSLEKAQGRRLDLFKFRLERGEEYILKSHIFIRFPNREAGK